MTYSLTVKPAYLSDLVGLPRHLLKRVKAVAEELQRDPMRPGGNITKLAGFSNLYRYRLGDHRLIYAVAPQVEVVELLAIGIRRDVYARVFPTPDLPARPVPEVAPDPADGHAVPPAARPARTDGTSDAPMRLERVRPQPSPARRLPPFTRADLAAWLVPEVHRDALLAAATEDELLDAAAPDEWKERVLDRLFPRPLPQVVEQPSLVLRRPDDLHDFAEGKLSAFLLQLDAEQQALVSRALDGPTLVKGGPGSGKSTVAVYRVQALLDGGYARTSDRPPRVLFTTFTHALTSATEQLLATVLGGRSDQVEVRTADSAAVRLLAAAGVTRRDIAEAQEDRRALSDARAAVVRRGSEARDLFAFLDEAALAELALDYLADEIAWVIEGRGLATREVYLAVDRAGRGIALDGVLRNQVWDIYEAYRAELDKRDRASWGQVRAQALDLLERRAMEPPYDYVIIDEAQDLTPVALRLCCELCRDPRGLFLTADAGQSLYNRHFSWSQVHAHLRVGGRTRILRRNYRTTAELAVAATDLLTDREDTEPVVEASVRHGARPIVKACADRTAQYDWLAARMLEAVRELRLPTSACGVLCPTRELAREAAESLTRPGLRAEVLRSQEGWLDRPAAKVLTMHAAKGLEFRSSASLRSSGTSFRGRPPPGATWTVTCRGSAACSTSPARGRCGACSSRPRSGERRLSSRGSGPDVGT